MSVYKGRRVFRSPRWILVLLTVCTVLFAIGAWIQFRTRGLGLGLLGAAALVVFGVLGIVEALSFRVELSDDAVHITRWWVRRSYARDSILRFTSEKGVSAGFHLTDGRWVKLPPVEGSVNSFRAWLRAGSG
ncbi:MAG: hypothetical protein M3303_10425 [Gemmatimonadota bacterium]|nr:hypothetical protein [Gemmatimonadota bacterium]